MERLTVTSAPTYVQGSQAVGHPVVVKHVSGDPASYKEDGGRKQALKEPVSLTSGAWVSSRGEAIVSITKE